ncbi:hypothetical protein [Paenibacillus sp. MMO-58]|uniref:hypothetical protein n=1 Tax=Paenibacillus sp. MMO-58 TaxID=3081290 RepID=UPI0030195D88
MFNIFKRKKKDDGKISTISISTAATFVIRSNLDELKEKWPTMKDEILNYEDIFADIDEERVQYEFMLAAMGADILALFNLFPKTQADKLFNELLKLLGESAGKIFVDAVNDYYSVAMDAVNKTKHPFDYIASLLLHRLDVPESECGPLTMMGTTSAVSQMIGQWKWLHTSFTVAAS